jgi:uncharacterized membrane protein
MYPSKIERTWGSGPLWLAAVVHLMSGGTLTWLVGFVTQWLWRGRSRFVVFHSLQVNYLGFACVLAGLAAWLLHWVPVVGGLLALAAGLTWLFTMVCLVIGAIAAGKGEAFEFPVVGQLARKNSGL